MAVSGDFDHQLKIDSTTENFRLIRDDDKRAMYSIENFVPEYRSPLTFTQSSWSGGHGEYTRKSPDKYFEGRSIDTTQDGRVFLGGLITTVVESDDTDLDAAVVKFIWFPAVSKWLCATSGKIYLYGTKWTAAATTVAGVTDLCVFGTTVFAACGASTAYKYSTDGDTWTTSTLDDTNANYFFVAPNSAGTAEVLWKAKTPNELKSNTSGINGGAQWSSVAYIGDASTNITNVFSVADNLTIGRTDGLWYYDTDGGIHQLRPDLDKNKSTDNFKYVSEWQGSVYHSEINGMGELTTFGVYEPVGALQSIENIGKRGSIVGMASDKDFLYVAIDEGLDTHIYKGREIWREGVGLRWEWCPWVYLGTRTCATIATCQHSTTDRRLWFGYSTGTTYETGWVALSDNPTADYNSRYVASGFVRMSYDYGSNAKWDKMWQSAVLEVSNGLTTATTIDVGNTATDRAGAGDFSGSTLVDTANAANIDGVLGTIEIWANTTLAGVVIGTFYLVSSGVYACRDSATIGAVTSGSKQTFTQDSSGRPLAIQVKSGDFIGCYYTSGNFEFDNTSSSGTWGATGDYSNPGDQTTYSQPGGTADDAYSFYATGIAQTRTVQVQYRKDTDTSATECIAAASTNGVFESNFSSALTCNRIQFQLNLASNTPGITPEVAYFQAKGVEKPTTTRIHEAVYAIGDEPTARAKTLRDLLRTARTSTALIRLSDLRYLAVGSAATAGTAGTDYVNCVMEPGYPQEVEITHRGKDATPELGIKVRLREVSYS